MRADHSSGGRETLVVPMFIRRPVFVEDDEGNWVAMKPAAPPDEETLEELIEHNPEIVAEKDGELLLVRRQKGVPDTEGGSNRWALDLLFVTREAVPVLIEVKQASNSELRRQVVGQLLDYAANGTAHWPPGEIQRAFETNCNDLKEESEIVLERFLDGMNQEDFWHRVDENLAAGKVRLVVAADAIPSELARVVEFLNDQMRLAEVRAVELRWFESTDGRRTLAPRTIGFTEQAHAERAHAKPTVSPEQWIDAYYGKAPDTASGIRTHLRIMEKLGLTSSVTAKHLIIVSGIGSKRPFVVYRSDAMIHVFPGKNSAVRTDLRAAVGDVVDHEAKIGFPARRLNDDEVREKYEGVVRVFIASLRGG